MVRSESLYSILTAAINDFIENGFDGEVRLRVWIERIRRAIQRETPSEHAMVQALRDALQIIFDREVTRGGLLKQHRGVPRWTLELLRPKLLDELTRRIIVASDLIKINREEAVAQTLRRFSGWMSSVPASGTSNVDRIAVKINIKKPLAALSYETRRLHIDQGAKMLANLSDIVAQDAGAIAGRWHSRWRVPLYNYRPDHKDRDEKVYAIRGSWAEAAGLINKGYGYTDEMTQPAEEVFCQCRYTFLYALKDLPENMITAKGRAELARVNAA